MLAVKSIRSIQVTDKVDGKIRYYRSSRRDDPAVLGATIRAHWSIENTVHWVLDVTFREDDEPSTLEICDRLGMYGDLQAVTGRSLPTIAALELLEATEASDAGKAVTEAFVPESA